MSVPLPPVLVVDDEKNMRLSLRTVLADDGYAVRAVESAEEALTLLGTDEFFMVITDARLGGISGYEFLGKARNQWPDLPILMITAYATPKLAVEAIKAGAIDYLAKPFAPEELLHAVARCAERYRLLQENATLRAKASEPYRLEHIVGECAKIRELRPRVVILPYWQGRHPDHYRASEIGYEACFLAGLRKIDERSEPYRPHKILYASIYANVSPSFVVDISTQFDRRMEALLSYRSQYGGDQAAPGLFPDEKEIRERLAAIARFYGNLIGVRYGEPFVVKETLPVDDIVALGGRSI